MRVNEIIDFGLYKWRVLEIINNRALIMSENIIDQISYHNKNEEVTWETSYIRSYLNNEFYNSFSLEDKPKIIKVTNTNEDNPWYKSKGGNDTEDYIFLLSLEDAVCKYFGDSSDKLLNKKVSDRYWFSKNDKNDIKRLSKLNNYPYWYWLRIPGKNNKTAVYIHGKPAGCLGINGNSVFSKTYSEDRAGGLRPIMWIKI